MTMNRPRSPARREEVRPRLAFLAHQPWTGLAGVVIVAAAFVLLGVVPGAQRSLEILGPISTFALPVLVVAALWWDGWPFSGASRPIAGALNTLLIAGASVALAVVGQAIVGRVDLNGLLSPAAAVERGAFVGFPFLVPLAVCVFLVTLQLTFVCKRWPLHKLPNTRAGFAALTLSWGLGLIAYLLIANWDFIPAPVQRAIGLSNPGGPMNAVNLLGFLTSLAFWQIFLFVLLPTPPTDRIAARVPRLIAANATVLVLGWLSYQILRNGFGWTIPRIAAVWGVGVAACLVIGMLFEGWPSRLAPVQFVAVIRVATLVVLMVAGYLGLAALGSAVADWDDSTQVDLWVAVGSLNYIASAIVIHYAVFRRWPLTPPAQPDDHSTTRPETSMQTAGNPEGDERTSPGELAPTVGRTTIPARPEPIEIDPARTAILVIDMTNDFSAPGGMFHRAGIDIGLIQTVVEPIKRVLSAARSAGIKVIYLQQAHSADLSDVGADDSPHAIKHRPFSIGKDVTAPDGQPSRILVDGTWNTAILAELAPTGGDIVIRKHRYSGFFETDLDATLKRLGADHLVVTGCTTSICVDSTVRDAAFRGYRCLVLEDCTAEPIGADLPRTNHEATMLSIETLFGWVSTSREMIEAWERRVPV